MSINAAFRFVQYVDEVLYKNARVTQVGGVPSPILRIKAFMNFVFRKNSGWTDSRFEVRMIEYF